MTATIGWMTPFWILGAVLANPTKGDTPDTTPSMHPRVRMETTLGTMVFELDGKDVPRTVSSFVSYVEDRFFDGTIFHRVLPGGLIQGGAFDATMDRKTDGLRESVNSETNSRLTNLRGTIVIYRLAGFVDSAKAEFFINVKDNPGLDQPRRDGTAYAVIGTLVEGLDTIDKIAATPLDTHPKYARGRSKVVPIDPVVIKSVRMLSQFDHKRALTIAQDLEIKAKKAAENAATAQSRAITKRIAQIEARSGQKMTATGSGLRYIVVRSGQGAPPIETETVSVQYRGTLADGKVFEDTYSSLTARPKKQRVSKFIEGLREGLLGMREGGKRIFVIPPKLAFQDRGVPNYIPPNSTLFFEVELLAIEDE